MSSSLRRLVALLCVLAALLAPSASSAEIAAPTLSISLGSGLELAMVLVPAGSFHQGSPGGEVGRGSDETLRDVTITSPFYVGRFPVTRGQFALFVQQSGYVTEAEKGSSGGSGWDGHKLVQRKDFTWRSPGFAQSDNDPVVLVTFADASAFAAWVSAKAGREVRLPSEAQWEYAARAGTHTAYFGAEDEKSALELGWFEENSAGGGTHPVGRKKPNAWNLHEVSGDVYEWCRDWYAPYEPGPLTDPEVTTPPTGTGESRRVLRGGSWSKSVRAARSAARYRNTPGSRNADNGFRLVADVRGPTAAAPARTTAPPSTVPTDMPASPPGGDTAVGIAGMAIVGIAIAAVIGVFGAIAAFVAISLRRGRGRGVLDASAVQTRLGPDGFWIVAPPGARVRYEAMVGGVPASDVVTLDGNPEGTFVYTGSSPTQVRILQATALAAAMPLAGEAAGRAFRADDAADLPEPPRGDPPAY